MQNTRLLVANGVIRAINVRQARATSIYYVGSTQHGKELHERSSGPAISAWTPSPRNALRYPSPQALVVLLESLSVPVVPEGVCQAFSGYKDAGDIGARARSFILDLPPLHRDVFVYLVRYEHRPPGWPGLRSLASKLPCGDAPSFSGFRNPPTLLR